jgi:phosphoribosylamine--glycine ligase
VKVLVIGSGGREHALAWKLAQSPQVTQVIVAPGNPGMGGVATVLACSLTPEAILELARQEAVDLVVIGPEAPLVAGAADLLEAAGIPVFGPGQAAAQLEGSKRFSKEFMERHRIPTAAYASFSDETAALDHLQTLVDPPVVKESGLAAGKGVTVARSHQEAGDAIRAAFRKPDSGGVVLEERLEGQELSLLLLIDGHTALPLVMAQDYKQLGDGDTGPMTGGMGAIAPVTLLSAGQQALVDELIVSRTLKGLQADGLDYRGVLFIGLMVGEDGVKVLEYNVRFGDPETQAVLPLLKNDLAELLLAATQRRLHEFTLQWRQGATACIVMAAPGYPGIPERGIPLGLPARRAGVYVFHAGTSLVGGRLTSSGGRVLNVVALTGDLQSAVAAAYEAVSQIDFPGGQFRSDIGSRVSHSLPR